MGTHWMSPLPSFLCRHCQFPLGSTLATGCAMCIMPDRTLSCGGRQTPLSSPVIVSPLPTRTVKEIEGDGGMDDQEVVPPVPSQHQLELCLRCPKASACHLAGAGLGGIGLIHNRSISLLHLMPPGNGNMFPDQVVVTPPSPSSTSYSPACNAQKHCPDT
jgi:hypothetical protein